MFFKIKATKDYRPAGWFRWDRDTNEAYLMKHAHMATTIPDRDTAYALLDMLQHGTIEASEGMSFEVVPA